MVIAARRRRAETRFNSSAQDSPRQNVSNAMKICVFGAGAIGGYLAVELSLAGHDVCVIARGEHLSAIASKALTLRMAGIQKTAIVCASDDPSRFGPQDYVFCTLKSHQAYTAAPSMLPLLGADTAVVTAMNGIHGGISTKKAARSKERT
ncbi:MAG: 2-dehydropantoate 2-reductase N-terminal domain-containing protein [Xanthobacteraceae bacterium]